MNVGRTQFPDIVSSVNDFSFTSTAKRDTQCSDFSYTSTSKRATQGFDIKDDAILEYDELFMAVFDISSLIDAGWNARKGDSLIAYIAIEDDDCEYTYVCMFVCAFELCTHAYVIVVPLFWSVHGECTEGISVN